jgi:hypothetical protein
VGCGENRPLGNKPSASLLVGVSIAYIQHLFDTGASRSKGTHTLLGLQQRWPHLLGRISWAWDSLRTWGLPQPITLRTPAPYPLWHCLVTSCLRCAMVQDKARADFWFQFVLFLFPGFHGLLRPGEAPAHCTRHIALASDLIVGERTAPRFV